MDLENLYYTAKGASFVRFRSLSWSYRPAGKKEDSPEDALKAFRAIVEQEETKGDWCVNLYDQPTNTRR